MNADLDLAKTLFNETWDLIDMENRTEEQTIEMLHKAHASCFLWREAKNPLNNARGEWQVSHVYSILGEGRLALLHGTYSLTLCQDNGIGGFDLAFGHEAVARAYKALGNEALMQEHTRLGLAACKTIESKEDREYAISCFQDL